MTPSGIETATFRDLPACSAVRQLTAPPRAPGAHLDPSVSTGKSFTGDKATGRKAGHSSLSSAEGMNVWSLPQLCYVNKRE
jgi:hypothetical protein